MRSILFCLGVVFIILGTIISIYVNMLPVPPGTPNILSDYTIMVENWPLSLSGFICWFFGAFLCAYYIRD
jgi:hypothetical protein